MARLHVHEYGDPAGEPLVCLHGLTGHGERFRRLAAALAHRRVLAPDLRGHGRSTWQPPWTTEQHVADVLETVGDEPADWLGFSFGGRIAAAVAAARPASVRRLVLLDPALTLPPDLAAEHAEASLVDESFADEDEALAEALAQPTVFSTPRELLAEDVVQHYVRGADGRLRARFSRGMAVTSWSEMAREAPPVADAETLAVTGARSWLPVDLARLAPARHVEVPGGHSVLWDDLPLTTEAVAAFLP
jgi:lipase